MRIIGHRGARGEAPENTLGGFQYIHDLGIRAVEFDVRQLKDHELIIMHDDNMLRTTGSDQALYPLSSTQLDAYNQAHIWLDWEKQSTPTHDKHSRLCRTSNILKLKSKPCKHKLKRND